MIGDRLLNGGERLVLIGWTSNSMVQLDSERLVDVKSIIRNERPSTGFLAGVGVLFH